MRYIRFCAALILSATLLLDAAEQRPEMRIYDVAELTTGARPHEGCIVSPDGGGNLQKATAASIQEWIRFRIHPESWDPARGTSIEEKGGVLVIMQSPDVHQLIREKLTEYRSLSWPQLVVKGLVIAAAEIPAESVFDANALAKVLGAKGMAGAVAAPRFVCFNGDWTTILSGRESSYVGGAKASGALLVPEIQSVIEGCVLQVRPRLADDARVFDAELRFTLTEGVDATEKRKLSTGPAPGAPAEKAAPTGLEIDALSMHQSRVRTTVHAPAGSWVLAGTLPNPDAAAAEKNLLFFLNVAPLDARIIGKRDSNIPQPLAKNGPPRFELPEPMKDGGAMQLRIFDVGDITTEPTDFPGRPMSPREERRENVVHPAYLMGDADLAALIKEKVFVEEFADPQLSVDANNGKVLVYQREKVLDKIAAWLADMRKNHAQHIAVKSVLVAAGEAPAESVFDEQGLNRILAAAGNRVVARQSFVCGNKQLSNVSAVRDHRYVSGVEVTGDTYVPQTNTMPEGCQLEARPIVAFDGAHVHLELRFALNSDLAKTKRTIGLSAGHSCDVDMLAMNTSQLQTQVAAPRGKWVLAGCFSSGNPNGPQKMLLFVSAEVVR